MAINTGWRIPFIMTEEEKLEKEHLDLQRQKKVLEMKIRNRKVVKEIMQKQKELQEVK